MTLNKLSWPSPSFSLKKSWSGKVRAMSLLISFSLGEVCFRYSTYSCLWGESCTPSNSCQARPRKWCGIPLLTSSCKIFFFLSSQRLWISLPVSISKAEITGTDFIQQVFILNFYFWFIFMPFKHSTCMIFKKYSSFKDTLYKKVFFFHALSTYFLVPSLKSTEKVYFFCTLSNKSSDLVTFFSVLFLELKYFCSIFVLIWT